MFNIAPVLPFEHPAPPPRKNGRPSDCTPERVERICGAIREKGHTITHAAALAGVSSSAVSEWKLKDEDFALRLATARAEYIDARLTMIGAACKADGTPDWRAQVWLLQHACPEEYGKPSRRHQLSEGRPEKEKENDPAVVDVEELKRLQQHNCLRVERLNGTSEAEARWIAAHLHDANPPPFPGGAGSHEKPGNHEAATPPENRANLPETPAAPEPIPLVPPRIPICGRPPQPANPPETPGPRPHFRRPAPARPPTLPPGSASTTPSRPRGSARPTAPAPPPPTPPVARSPACGPAAKPS